MNTAMEKRKQQEIDFHDMLRDKAPQQRWSLENEEQLKADPLWVNFKYYSIERKSLDFVDAFLRERCPGKRVLDYCCGSGDDTVGMAKMGAREVVGIDLSEAGLKHGRQKAIAENVEDKTKFIAMDAEALEFEEGSFDLVKVYGCLHHLDMRRAFSELARVLKPDGSIVCTEALGHNALIQMYRKRTPKLRTEYEAEHLIKRKDLEAAREYFAEVEPTFFHLATLFAVPLRRLGFFDGILSTLQALDSVLLRFPLLKWQAWQVVFTLSKPRREPLGAQ
jgi:ubiquinone/menaquinone biosynthesis C-methylase UbiE